MKTFNDYLEMVRRPISTGEPNKPFHVGKDETGKFTVFKSFVDPKDSKATQKTVAQFDTEAEAAKHAEAESAKDTNYQASLKRWKERKDAWKQQLTDRMER